METATLEHQPSSQRLPKGIALVSGGSSGIGRAVVSLFVAHGAKVVVLDLQPPEVPFAGEVVFSQGSVANEADWEKAVSLTKQTFGQTPNILVQSAGITGKGAAHNCSMEEWSRIYGVNATGVFLGMKYFVAPLLEENRPGSIVNVSSISGLRGMNVGIAYEASKGACTHMSRSAAVAYAKNGIRVNAVHPGLTKTELIVRANRPESDWATMMNHTPLGRWGTSEEVAYCILYLASDEAAFVTGALVTHDGGYTAM